MANGNDRDFAQVLKESFDPDGPSLRVTLMTGLVPKIYDSIELSYTGDNVSQVIYRSGGIVIATLDLTYSGDNLIQVDRS